MRDDFIKGVPLKSCPNDIDEKAANKTKDQLDRLRLENARLASLLKDVCHYFCYSGDASVAVSKLLNEGADEASSTALRELLEPTIKLLEELYSNVDTFHPGSSALKAIHADLTRLRSITSPTDKTSEGVEG